MPRAWLALTLLVASSLALSQNASPKLLEGTVTYKSGALSIKALVVRPDVRGKLPAVILNHGGTDGITDSTKARARDLARSGFAVFASTYRGEDGSDGKIEIAKGEVDDVLAGTAWFAKQPFVDAGRIGMMGSSHGALIGLLATARTNQVKALVFAYGVADIYAWYAHLKATNQLGNDAVTREVYGKGPDDKPQNFLERHGLRVVPDLPPGMPILILQGERDTIVPPDQAQRLADMLEAQGQPHTLRMYPKSAHGFVTAREAVLKKYGAKSAEYAESIGAWTSAVRFLSVQLTGR
jgi:dipeptidyl aminopeptidase/acylaminoacyl peptidase